MTFPEMVSKDHIIRDNIITLEQISYQIAELSRIKEEIEARLRALFEHGEDYSKTYYHDKWKVTISTGWNYSLDKEEYEVLKERIPVCFDPVRKRVAYDLDKKVIADAEKYAGDTERRLLEQILKKSPKKLHVKIGAGA